MKILVGLSWWVDSAVAAYLLQKAGHEVVAGFMINYMDDKNPNCPTRQDRDSAMEVCKYLNLPFEVFDYREEYEKLILEYIYDGYLSWITPNPDVYCNSLVKFGIFMDEARGLGFDAIATGHYAKIVKSENTSDIYIWNNTDSLTYKLLRWIDYTKDQSYFLSGLNQRQLSMAMFPLGDYSKTEIRQIAKEAWLPNADRPDSQWLCFVGKVNMKDFLISKIGKKPGYIYDLSWKIVWNHDGAYIYTIGQRRQIGLNFQCYVCDVDVINNIVVVARPGEEDVLYNDHIYIDNCNWIDGKLPEVGEYDVKIRYRQEPVSCVLDFVDQRYGLTFPEAVKWIANGQIAVIYDGDRVVGNWVISKL